MKEGKGGMQGRMGGRVEIKGERKVRKNRRGRNGREKKNERIEEERQ